MRTSRANITASSLEARAAVAKEVGMGYPAEETTAIRIKSYKVCIAGVTSSATGSAIG